MASYFGRRSIEEKLWDQTTRILRGFGHWRPSSQDIRAEQLSQWHASMPEKGEIAPAVVSRQAREMMGLPTTYGEGIPKAELPVMSPDAAEEERRKRMEQAGMGKSQFGSPYERGWRKEYGGW